jgi:hypothetical protein
MKHTSLALLPSLVASSLLLGCSGDGPASESVSTNAFDDQGSPAPNLERAARGAFGAAGDREPASRLRVEQLPASGRTLYSQKYFDSNTGEISGVTIDSQGGLVDRDEALREERTLYKERYGAFSEALASRVEALASDSNERIPVMLWLDESSLGLPEFPAREVWNTDAQLQQWVAASESVLQERRVRIEAAVRDLSDGFDGVASHAPLPLLVGSARVAKLAQLKHDARLTSVQNLEGDGVIVGDLADAAGFMRVAGSDSLHGSGYQGSGVKAGIWHWGVPNFTSQLGAPVYRLSSASPSNDQHLAYMIASVKNNRTTPSRGTGFAPSASIYVANFNWVGPSHDSVNNAIAGYNWARDTIQTPVLNQSWHFENAQDFNGYPGDEQASGDQSYIDRLLDYGAHNYPYLLPVQAAGNINIDNEFVNHKGWNTLVIGQDLQSSQMASSSCFRNGNPGHELPHVTAGADTSMSMFENADGSPVVTANGGTSVAAALMTGFAASLISVDPLLTYYPEVLRAIVMASAKNVVGQEMHDGWRSDQQDGAGRPDGAFARNIARNRTRNTSGLGAAGYQIASFGSTGQTRSLSITTPGGRLKVAISWFARVSGTNFVNTSLSDLDVRVLNSTGGVIAYSTQGDEPAEVIGIDVPAGTYTLHISGYSVPSSTVYGVAWVTQ